jgi:hypothetical protein
VFGIGFAAIQRWRQLLIVVDRAVLLLELLLLEVFSDVGPHTPN